MAIGTIVNKLNFPPDFKRQAFMVTSINQLMIEVKQYISKEEDCQRIIKAAKYVKNKFKDIKRKNGDPYFYHLLTTAFYVANWKCSPPVIIGALLHDLIEDIEGETKKTVEKMFGSEVAFFVDKVTKIRLYEKSHANVVASNMRKILLGMAQDVRVMLIKMGDRQNNIETLFYLKKEKQIRYAEETLTTYVPIARALGFNKWVRTISSLCFWYINREKYYSIFQDVKKLKKDEKVIDQSIAIIKRALRKHKVFYLEFYGREKSIFSIHRKIEQKGDTITDVHDIFALRIICDRVSNCYSALGAIHQEFKIVKNRFKDYIASPKGNMYQSIHTTIMINNHKVEVQIRTETMHEIAERGIAAHWRYKENQQYSSKKQQKEIMSRIHILKSIIKYDESVDESDITSDSNWWSELQKEVFGETIICLTPNKKAIEMKKGATVLDFAFHIHTEVGLNAIRGIVNGKSKMLKHVLQAGDIVEIITQNKPNFSIKWLSYVATSMAKNKLKKALKQAENISEKNQEKEKIKNGKNAFKNYLEGTNMWTLYQKHKDVVEKWLLKREEVQNMNQVYINLSSSRKVLNPLFEFIFSNLLTREEQLAYGKYKKGKQKFQDDEIIIDGVDGLKIDLANCCNPIYGDKIIALVSKRSGLRVHKDDCRNVLNSSPFNDTFDAYWGKKRNKIYKANLLIEALNHDKMISNILSVFAATNVEIINIKTKFIGNSRLKTHVQFYITSTIELALLMRALRETKNILHVERTFFKIK